MARQAPDKRPITKDLVDVIDIDGSKGEGGGQMVRTAISLSAVTRRAVRITNIRMGRKDPGLKAQHVEAVRAVGQMCGADIEGDERGSLELVFVPDAARGCRLGIDIGTAGSTTLLLQALLPVAVSCGGESYFRLTGGTDVKWSPQADFMTLVIGRHLKRMGLEVHMAVTKRGYYPKGGGVLDAHIVSKGMPEGLDLSERGTLEHVHGMAHSGPRTKDIAEGMKEGFMGAMVGKDGVGKVDVAIEASDSFSPGHGITAAALFSNTIIGVDVLGEGGGTRQSGVSVGKEAAERLSTEMASGGTLDIHASDMLLPFMAMAKGPSTFCVHEVSSHARTNMDTIARFIDVEFVVRAEKGRSTISVIPGPKGQI